MQTDQQWGDVFHRRKRSLDPRGEGGEDGWRFCGFVLSKRLRLVTPASKQTVPIQRSGAEQHPKAKEENRVVALEVRCIELGLLCVEKNDCRLDGIAAKHFFFVKNPKISFRRRISCRYAGSANMYHDFGKMDLEEENARLKKENEDLRKQVETLEKNGSPNAEAKIKALSDEVARLTAILNNDGTNSGTLTSKTPIGKKKHIPNSREKTGLKKGGQPGHKRHTLDPVSDDEVNDTEEHPRQKRKREFAA